MPQVLAPSPAARIPLTPLQADEALATERLEKLRACLLLMNEALQKYWNGTETVVLEWDLLPQMKAAGLTRRDLEGFNVEDLYGVRGWEVYGYPSEFVPDEVRFAFSSARYPDNGIYHWWSFKRKPLFFLTGPLLRWTPKHRRYARLWRALEGGAPAPLPMVQDVLKALP